MPEIGFCGDDCRLCPRYLATMSGNVDKLKEVAAMWERVGWRDKVVSPEEIKCNGCKTVKWCRYNELRECAQGREISNCGECDKYPCDNLLKVFEQTAIYDKKCQEYCSGEDYKSLYSAFFSKRNKLDEIHMMNFQNSK